MTKYASRLNIPNLSEFVPLFHSSIVYSSIVVVLLLQYCCSKSCLKASQFLSISKSIAYKKVAYEMIQRGI